MEIEDNEKRSEMNGDVGSDKENNSGDSDDDKVTGRKVSLLLFYFNHFKSRGVRLA